MHKFKGYKDKVNTVLKELITLWLYWSLEHIAKWMPIDSVRNILKLIPLKKFLHNDVEYHHGLSALGIFQGPCSMSSCVMRTAQLESSPYFLLMQKNNSY